ncbi:MAG TPA: hypothetical protein VK791_01575 [bacterium]|nr:hypothetical protein [bacterium]
MKCVYILILLIAALCAAKDASAQTQTPTPNVKYLYKDYETISAPRAVPDNDQMNFDGVVFSFGWNKKAPYAIAVQFVNRGYEDRKMKFAIKDITAKKMIILDRVHNSAFGLEVLKQSSVGAIWAGPIDNPKNSFSLHVWDAKGNEFDAAPVTNPEPVSTGDQK